MADIVKLGSLYFNGQPQNVGVTYNNEQISFGNTAPGRELQWVRLQSGLLVADRCACKKISWEQLDHMGFVYGAPVRIDGEYYLCRCLKIGNQRNVSNEWDSLLSKFGEDNNLWHWEETYFWGQETSKYDVLSRAVRGYHSARYWYYYNAANRFVSLGFRPVLEPLGPEPCLPDTLVGRKVKVYGPNWMSVEGTLAGFDNYDLVLKNVFSLPTNCSWAITDRNKIIARRDCICWLKEA